MTRTRPYALRLLGLLLALLASACNGQNATVREVETEALPAAAAPPPVTAPPPVRREVGALPSLAPLVESVKSAVVNVDVQARGRGAMAAGSPFDPFFGGAPVRQGAGSGSLINPRGRVLTNHHVVAEALSIRVRLDDGRSFNARVLGGDPLTDLALLQLEGVEGELPYVALGDSDAMRVGDYVVAIGNPFGLASSVSAGILSARARDIQAGPYDDFLQTDAAINPGNSGGPLFNLKGEVVGINTAIVGGGSGIGFAVPSNIATLLLPQLEKGVVRRGWLGVAVQDLTPELARALGVSAEQGAVVSEVTEGTPAKRAGLRPEDVVVRINGEPVEDARALTRTVGFLPPGSEVTLTVARGKETKKLQLTLGERPDLEGVRRARPQRPSTEEESTTELGLTLRDGGARGEPRGALVVEVQPGSVAETAGLVPGMVIVEAGGQPVRSARDLMRQVQGAESGHVLLLRVQLGQGRVLRALPVP
jgi:serine protease Do